MADRTIVVGAGSAGAIIAARMSESSAHDVVLVEAGPDYPDLARLPPDLLDGTRNALTSHDWGYSHAPVEGQMRMHFPRGRVVGGSSAVNTCIAIRGQAYDYDEWAARGLPEWSFEKCLPAFKRFEDDRDFGDAPYHGSAGPIAIRRHPRAELATWQAAFLDACADLGFDSCPDSNAPDGTGAGPHAMNKIDGVRQSAARGYLTREVRARPNLDIRSGTDALSVAFDGEHVVGLDVSKDGRIERIAGTRVVLSGGAVGTPLVLLRSGIGPAALLARHGVARVADLPGVGHQLLDHPGCAIFLLPKPGVVKPLDPLIQTVLRYHPERGRRNEMQIQPGSFVPLHRDVPVVTLMTSLGKPSGSGTIEFPSLAVDAKPILRQRFLEHPDDLAKACEAIDLMSLLLDTPAMRSLARPLLPGRRGLHDRKTIATWIRRQTGSGFHPCGTAPMGADDDRYAVCDQYGRVRGTRGLFVADASLMPTVPSANTNLASLMIGERFGEWLRDGIVG